MRKLGGRAGVLFGEEEEQTGRSKREKGKEEDGSSSLLCVWSVENHSSTTATTIISQQQRQQQNPPPPSSFPKEKRQTNERNEPRPGEDRENRRTDGRIETDFFMTTTTITTTREKQIIKNTHHHFLTSHSPHNLFWGCSPIICSRGAWSRLRTRRDDDEEPSHSLHPTTTTTTGDDISSQVQSSPVSRRYHVFDYFPGGGRSVSVPAVPVLPAKRGVDGVFWGRGAKEGWGGGH